MSFADRVHAVQDAIDAGMSEEEIREQGIGQRLWPSEYDKLYDANPIIVADDRLVYEPVDEAYARHAQQAADDLVENGGGAVTPAELAIKGVRRIKRECWTEGSVYLTESPDGAGDPFTWCYIHPTDDPAEKPQPVFLKMLPCDDWEEIPDVKKVSKQSVRYRIATTRRKCGNCSMRHGHVCDLVDGFIGSNYTCTRWTAKEKGDA